MFCFDLICITTPTKPSQMKRQFSFKIKKNFLSRIDTFKEKNRRKIHFLKSINNKNHVFTLHRQYIHLN